MTPNSRVVASIVNFEFAHFDEVAETEKPENSVAKMRSDARDYGQIKDLLDAVLLAPNTVLPVGAIAWQTFDELERAVSEREGAITLIT
jgi:putative ATP-dependent endonuclease of OLD family